MKSKRLTVILSVMLIIGIGLSIYQHNTTLELKNRLSVLANTKDELTKEIESNTEELKRVTSEIEKAKKTNAELTVKRDNLAEKNKELRSKVEALKEESSSSVNSTHTDIELTEDEYQGDSTIDNSYNELSPTEQDIVDDIVEDIMSEHPEWFNDSGNNASSGNYEHVGTEDNTANTPQIQFGQGDYSGLGSDVTVY